MSATAISSQDVPGSATVSANATQRASAGAVVTGEATADLTVPFTRSAIRRWRWGGFLPDIRMLEGWKSFNWSPNMSFLGLRLNMIEID